MTALSRKSFRAAHRLARLGSLGSLACRFPAAPYQWFLREVYDLRHPHVGNDRHSFPRTFDSLRGRLTRQGSRFVRV